MKRKNDHIDLTFKSQTGSSSLNTKFNYEPMLSAHPTNDDSLHFSTSFLGKNFKFPLWFSSMTGGAERAKTINHNMAKIVKKYSLGMGLGSCRSLLDSNEHLIDFQVRDLLGDDRPLYANLGLAQVEQLVERKQFDKIVEVIKKLEADGLIIHVNPLQEWFQPEGDRFNRAPIETISELIDKLNIKIAVKEVGHGIGPESLKALNKLPLVAIELSGYGGTNFSMLEQFRGEQSGVDLPKTALINIGHTAEDMIDSINEIDRVLRPQKSCDIIISGGVADPLLAYYLYKKLKRNSVIGQAASVLKFAMISEELLDQYVFNFMQTFMMAEKFAKPKL